MSQAQSSAGRVEVDVRNVGGIERSTVQFEPGITVLAGRNATNRTSFLQALMAGLGSDRVSLKGDAEEGSVELSFGDRTYTRTLTREGGTVVTSGDPYLEDPTLADLFGFLLESNEARRAVARGDDLREIIMEPIDMDAIQNEIEELEAERRRIASKLEELSDLEGRLPQLEERRTQLSADIEDKRATLEETEAEIESADADVEDTREEKAELNDKLDQLSEKRSDLENVRFRIESEQESLSTLRDERDELAEEREEMPDAPVGEIEEIDSKLDRLRDQIQTLDSGITELQTIIQFNEDMLEGTSTEVLEALREDVGTDASGGSVTDQLLDESKTVVCWTCGSEVETTQIERTVDRLRDLRQTKVEERNELRERIDELKRDRSSFEKDQSRREQVQRRLRRTEDEIEDRESTLERLKDRRKSLTDEIERLEGEVDELEAEEYSEILDLHKRANQLEFELGKLESELDRVDEETNEVETRLSEREELSERRDEIRDEIEDLRTRIEQIETQAVDEFNEHMEAVLDILDYANLERIWIERTEREVREGRRKVTRAFFDLHIVRKTASGSVYEDTVDHLSESEREVTGLVFALAGYLAHDVYEAVPFILLDSLEAIDSDRIAALVEYIDGYADYLVVALLPEDASAISEEHERISEI
ncbi:archaea-specific SMC-related protein [Halegenticoccus tardaugens]|uniref:archaea-specific SMC-related protein n=1 Tax=Halegenticoccus tardaugens TaxID=2071624 RepID=UPI00100B6B16|nr:archaea-specific SMC-related protein [Halegenticoccus tardaugens]